jgi:CDGSH-type Zn-finger protein/uncharacterized Fe-S cluster protein YjdI
MSRKRTYSGNEIDILFDARRCIHAERCVHGLRSVFDRDRRPWVDPDGASADEVMAVVGRCPTGALAAIRHDGADEERPDARVSVTISPDGPAYVRGDLRVGVPGEVDPRTEARIALCRCGHSAHKPFCDNAHVDAGFEGETLREMPERAVAEASEPAGATVEVRENGPVILRGSVRFEAADGTVGWITNPALCRCGRSQNKPFCDGSHKDGQFIAPGAG